MSALMKADAIAHDDRTNMALKDCPDCQGKSVINICGDDVPCPTCQPDVFEAGCGGLK